MGLLKLAENIKDVDLFEYRDSLYYNKYDYRLRIKIPGVRYTYWCKTPEDLDKKLARANKSYGNVRTEDIPMVTANLAPLKEVVKIVKEKSNVKNYTCRLESDTLAIFSSDLSVLNQLKTRIGEQFTLDCTQAQTSGFAGTKYFVREPKRKYRVYFRSKRVEEGFHKELREVLSKQKKLYPSTGLKQWLHRDQKNIGAWYFRWLSAAHYIDYDEESTLSYLALMYGNHLGKRYKLEKRPDNI